MMKVEEAKTKVCPILSMGGTAYNCICGDCMAWIWKEIYEKKNSVEIWGENFSLPKERGWKSLGYDEDSILWAERTLMSDSEGYCIKLVGQKL